MPTLEEQLRAGVALLQKHKLSFAVAGGMAASIYREEERLTKDIDFIIDGSGDLVQLSKEMISELGLRTLAVRKADLEGGPLFAIKKKNTAVMLLIGRDPDKKAPGVDFLLPINNWVPRALERAKHNMLDWGFERLPTLTAEDVIVAKLISSKSKNREQDILDLRSIFRSECILDFTYLIARMKEFSLSLPMPVYDSSPIELQRASRRIARQNKS